MDPANNPPSPSNNNSPPFRIPFLSVPRGEPRDGAGQPPALGGSAQQPLDTHMDTDEDDDMPGLQDVSDSSDDEDDDESHDVEMHPPAQASSTASSQPGPSTSSVPVSSTRTNSNRRARVEEDDDSERDRRHPSHRTASRPAGNNQQQPQQPQLPRPTLRTTIRLMTAAGERIDLPFPLGHLHPGGNAPNNHGNADGPAPATNAAPTANPATPAGNRPRPLNPLDVPGAGFFISGMMSIPIPGLDAPAGPAPVPGDDGATNATNNNPPPAHDHAAPPPGGLNPLQELLSAVGLQLNQALAGPPGAAGGIPININLGNFTFGLEEKEDPERAKKLVEGLEDVPVGLVKRLVRVGGTGGGMGEDESKGGDAGCAICWDNLLDAEGEGFGKPEPAAPSDETNAETSSTEEAKQPRIISLPCAHVFHADCLIPWFSRPRQTTCPTCRFNIDPDNLTYVSASRRDRERRAAARAANPDAPAEGNAAPGPAAGDAAAAPAPEVPAGNTANVGNPPSAEGNLPQPGQPPNAPTQRPRRPHSHITMDIIMGLPLWPPLGQPGAPPLPPHLAGPAQADQPGNGDAEGAEGGAEDHPPIENARDALERAVFEQEELAREIGFRELIRRLAVPADPPAGPGAADHAEHPDGEDAHDRRSTERAHRAASEPPPSTGASRASSSQPQQQAPPAPGAGAAGPAPPHVHPGQNPPRGTQLPPFLPNLFNIPPLPRNPTVMTGTGRTVQDALHQIIGGLLGNLMPGANVTTAGNGQPTAPQDGAQQDASAPAEGGEAAEAPAPAPAPAAAGQAQAPAPGAPGAGAPPPFLTPGHLFAAAAAANAAGAGPNNAAPNANNAAPNADANGTAGPLPNVPPFRLFPFPFPPDFDLDDPMFPHTRARRGPKPAWTLPPAPGPTLRQRIERREREAGLRCYDVSCGIGPSDEEPELSEAIASMKQLAIKGADGAEVCAHRFHSACLVSAERVAMAARSAELVRKDGNVEVSCPVCRGTGSVTEEEWNEGVVALG